MDVAGEFIYTAALLIHIKSKMLLPRAPAGPDDAAEDPRRELVERLLEHERFKNAAQMLQEKQMLEAATWTNPGMREFREDAGAEPEIAADTVDLVRIFRDILERARNRPILNVQEDTVTVGQMIQFLARRLTMEDKPVALRRLLSHTHSERALIAMFLALLEMVRLQAILLRQDRHFSEIFIKKHTGFEAVMNQGLAERPRRLAIEHFCICNGPPCPILSAASSPQGWEATDPGTRKSRAPSFRRLHRRKGREATDPGTRKSRAPSFRQLHRRKGGKPQYPGTRKTRASSFRQLHRRKGGKPQYPGTRKTRASSFRQLHRRKGGKPQYPGTRKTRASSFRQLHRRKGGKPQYPGTRKTRASSFRQLHRRKGGNPIEGLRECKLTVMTIFPRQFHLAGRCAAIAALLLAIGPRSLRSQPADPHALERGLALVPLPDPPAGALPLPEDRGAADLEQTLKRLGTTASVLAIVAHPDDEDGALLTYLARGLGARVTLLTLTRGEGGQNAMSAESYDALGLIRTQRTAQGRRILRHQELWGTEADFGFSKTQEEAFAKWGHDRVLYDAVLAVRLCGRRSSSPPLWAA